MPESEIPAHNIMVDCHEPHTELLDLTNGTVWQSQQPMTHQVYDALELPPKIVRVGIGTGVMDSHYFRRSPGAEADGPVAERTIDGHLFIHCANPPKGGPETPLGDDPKLMRVDKHHSLIFNAGREVAVLRLPDGRDFVQVIAATPEGGGLLQPKETSSGKLESHLPDGCVLRSEKVAAHTVIHLPHPTEAWFFKDGTSYQGPVDTFKMS